MDGVSRVDGSRVLVVEDDSIFRDMLGEFLQRSGIPSDQTRDRAAAIALARRNRYAAALIDLNLMRDHGVDVAAALREVAPDLALVFVSGDIEGSMEGRSFPPGSVSLKKPLDLDRLRRLLEEILAPKVGFRKSASSGASPSPSRLRR